jgi:hypothetical protein
VEQITEGIIKKVALRFFRNYYKFRLRNEDQPVESNFDMHTDNGIVADGYYSFKKHDGTSFIATFEATSAETREEVQYRPQNSIRFWDAVAVGFVFTAILAFLNYLFQFHVLDERSVLIRIILISFSFGISFLVFYILSANFQRYRYIYAIEQFKKYQADEQWIALAADVFSESDDQYFRELKQQCVLNGFGLLLVEKSLNTKILITPSRHDVFKGSRKVFDFRRDSNKFKGVGLSLFQPIGNILGLEFRSNKKPERTILARYRKTFYSQMVVSFCCTALVAFLIWKEMQNIGFREVEPAEYISSLARSQSNEVLEQQEYLGDSASTIQRKNARQNFWLQASQPKVESKIAESGSERKDHKATVFPDRREGERFHIYDCSRYNSFQGTLYFIAEGEYATLFHTRVRLQQLYDQGLESGAVRQDCFFKRKPGFVVYLGMFFETEDEAKRLLATYSANEFLKDRKLKLLVINPKNT